MNNNFLLSDDPVKLEKSWSRWLIDGSCRIGYIPVSWNGESYDFRLLSWPTLVFFLVYFPLPFYLFGIMTIINPDFYIKWMDEIFQRNNSIDAFTVIGFMTICYIFGPLSNIIVASAMPKFPSTRRMSSPRNKTGLLLSYLALVTGSFFLTLGFYLGKWEDDLSPEYIVVVGSFLLPFLGFLLSFTHYFWTSFTVCCWLSEFIHQCCYRQ